MNEQTQSNMPKTALVHFNHHYAHPSQSRRSVIERINN